MIRFFFLSFFYFFFHFCFLFFAFFLFIPPEANHNFLFVLADFSLVENEKGLAERGDTTATTTSGYGENETGFEWATGPGCPFSILCLRKNDNYHCYYYQQETDFKQIESPIPVGRSIGRVTTPMRELSMLVSF